MEFSINEVGQVMKRVIEETFTEETPVGMEKQYETLELVDRTICQWQKFDLSQGKYVVDPANTTPIVIDGVSYVPVNGVVEVMKQIIIQPEGDEEIVNLYEAVIVLDDRVTTLEKGGTV
ncbi:MAG: hypothetical protein K0R93_1054 [Anaerosolibacter sp.]|jgi:hypothetical protein|uniref:hypothetical protein n=1 Tax=Anaerosolibacter sp. TaxID=1872527 RepID=UPI0026250154|nr:hypothetical protein [Anaerosolibacter sp.]MDF2546156.1 hypothetical protein [Anaerosolibacter sp.]